MAVAHSLLIPMPDDSPRANGPWIVAAFVIGLIGMLTLAYFALQGAKDIGGNDAALDSAPESPQE